MGDRRLIQDTLYMLLDRRSRSRFSALLVLVDHASTSSSFHLLVLSRFTTFSSDVFAGKTSRPEGASKKLKYKC